MGKKVLEGFSEREVFRQVFREVFRGIFVKGMVGVNKIDYRISLLISTLDANLSNGSSKSGGCVDLICFII